MEARKLNTFTIEEYLEYEKTTEERCEYLDGFIAPIAAGTVNHGILCGNAFAEVRSRLRKKKSNCIALSSAIKIHINSENAILCPDAMVVCGSIERSAIDQNAISNPILIIEVLSKSTGNYDRGDKFYKYPQLPTLKEYVLIDQYKTVVEVYSRQEKSDIWKIVRTTGLTNNVELQSIGILITMEELYADVEGV